MKKVVYTCITAHYDELYNHTFMHPDWDYVCFTDDLSIATDNNSNWQIRPLQFTILDNTRNQRWHKLHPHLLFPDYDYSLWVDANIDILNTAVFNDVKNALERGEVISIAPHPERNCIYEEFKICKLLKKDEEKIMEAQIETYKKDGFPQEYGLFETNVIFRKHKNINVIKLMNDWWYWVSNMSKRDQLSLTYTLWKNHFVLKPMSSKTYRNNDGRIELWPHRNEFRNNSYLLHLNNLVRNQSQQLKAQSQQLKAQSQQLKAQSQHFTLLNKYNVIRDEVNQLEADFNEIKSAKFFKLWQAYATFRKKLL